jgi:hypothetical protein
VRALGERLVGHVPDAEREAANAGPLTLVHGDATGLPAALPSAAVQAVLSLAGTDPGSEQADGYVRRLGEVARRLA